MLIAAPAAAAIDALVAAAAGPLDPHELGRMAQMHTHCQALCDADPAPGDAALSRQIVEVARRLARLIETLILDDAADPRASLGLVARAVETLRAARRGASDGLRTIHDELEAALKGDAAGAPPAARSAAQPEFPRVAAADSSGGAAEADDLSAMDPGERAHLQEFLAEGREHVDAIEAALLALERDPHDRATLDRLFRPFHTIKGIAGFLNLNDIRRVAHEVESVLARVRAGTQPVAPDTIDLVFAATDVLKAQLDALEQRLTGSARPSGPPPDVAAMLARLRQATGAGSDSGAAPAAAPSQQAAPPASASSTPRPNDGTGQRPAADRTIRVDTNRLDALVDAVGELVIAQSTVQHADAATVDERLRSAVAHVSKIVRGIQETATGLRMAPIGPTLQRMRRLVRDVARKAGRQVELHTRGDDTELDLEVVQQIGDPLVHLVRNAIDHGIEPPADRRAAGKDPTGGVWLSAAHQGDRVLIEVRDDGRGLARERILAQARARGLVGRDESPESGRIQELIFAPGFSTAEQVSEISGRGVGLDVVKRSVAALRGEIEVSSEAGRGSVFRIRLPLTLAIIDGMVVRVGAERLLLPTVRIERSVRPTPAELTTVPQRGQMLAAPGRLCPLVQLGELFGFGPRVDPCRALVVVVRTEREPLGLVVEEQIGQQSVVIKPLDGRFRAVRGVSGAAILGDGRVGLILEPDGLLDLHRAGGPAGFARAG